MVILDMSPTRFSDMRSNSLKQTQGPGGDNISSKIRDLKGDSDVGLRGEVVDFIRGDSVDPTAERGGVGEIGVVEFHPGFVGIVWVDVDVVDSLGVEV